MIEEAVLRKAKILKKKEDYSKFIRNIRQTVSDNIISDISPLYLAEPRGVYQNKSLHVIKPRSTKEVSECLKLATKYKIGIVPWSGGTGPTNLITFRVAQANHKEGEYNIPTSTYKDNPYTLQPLSSAYSATSTLLNVDTFSLANINSNLFTCSPLRNVVPPWSVISVFCNICLTITSICLSSIATP